jgi:rRNA-processing protein FCF1
MTNSEKKTPDHNAIFSLETTFPDADGLFFGGFLGLTECFNEAIFVLDTNVLLMPYSLGNRSINEIKKVYSKLINENRLFVPERVAREFATNRASKVADIYASIEKKKTGKTKHEFNYPIINDLEERVAVEEALKKYKEAETAYFRAIDPLLEKIRSWEWADPVSELYSALFNASTLCTHKLLNEDLQKELGRRFMIKQPPGYKDATKDDGGVGDLAIWLSLLELGKTNEKHAILVSEDGKPDWWQKSNGAEFLPRYELVDEYRRASNGKTLHIVKLSKLLELFEASNAAIEEAQTIERLNRMKVDEQQRLITSHIFENAKSIEKQYLHNRKRWDLIQHEIHLEKKSEKVRFRAMSRQEMKGEILEWFHSNYIAPEEVCPYESAEGGYQYIWGGPYDAHEVIEEKYDGVASRNLISEIVSELNEISWEWSSTPSGDDDSIELDDIL